MDPNRLLAATIDVSPGLRALFLEAVSRSPPSLEHPWSLVVGFDEFTPGDKLNTDNRRKTMVLSYSFLELGQVALSHAASWMTTVCVRSSVIRTLTGGWSHMMALYLKRQLFGPDGLATAGVPLVLDGDPDRPTVLFARLACLLSDGEGLKHVFDSKGSSGIKPCFKHFNVFRKDRGVHT